MSDSTTSAPAPADSGSTDRGAPIAPAPSSQPAISVSEAARVLNERRREQRGEPTGPAPPERKPSPNELVTAPPQKPAAAPAKAPAPAEAETGFSALERALGVPPGATAPESTPDTAAATIEVAGTRYTAAQLQEAISKSTDYTKKTQELADRSRQLQAQTDALAQVLPYIQPELARLAEVVNAQASKPDISLMQTDPAQYFQQLHNYEAIRAEQERLGNLNTLQAQAQQRAAEAQLAAANEQLTKEFPFWADEKQRSAIQQQVVDWATTKGGFQRDELRGLTDARALKAMMKAAIFDQWVSGTRTAAPAPQTAAPVRGSAPPPAPTERVQVASEAFETRPNIRTGTALLTARRSNGSAPR